MQAQPAKQDDTSRGGLAGSKVAPGSSGHRRLLLQWHRAARLAAATTHPAVGSPAHPAVCPCPADAPLIAVHKGRIFKEPDGLSLGPGPFVLALEHATGRTAQASWDPAAWLGSGRAGSTCGRARRTAHTLPALDTLP